MDYNDRGRRRAMPLRAGEHDTSIRTLMTEWTGTGVLRSSRSEFTVSSRPLFSNITSAKAETSKVPELQASVIQVQFELHTK